MPTATRETLHAELSAALVTLANQKAHIEQELHHGASVRYADYNPWQIGAEAILRTMSALLHALENDTEGTLMVDIESDFAFMRERLERLNAHIQTVPREQAV